MTVLTLRSAFVLSSIALSSAFASAQSVLTSVERNGHIYSLLTASTWTDAEAKAVSMGGHLVTLNDALEHEWLYATFTNFEATDRNLWIGLNDAAQEGTFVWSSGEMSTYRNWAPGQPDDGIGFGEDYVHTWPLLGGAWNDLPNAAGTREVPVAYGVVEVQAVPEPTSTAALGLCALGVLKRRKKA